MRVALSLALLAGCLAAQQDKKETPPAKARQIAPAEIAEQVRAILKPGDDPGDWCRALALPSVPIAHPDVPKEKKETPK